MPGNDIITQRARHFGRGDRHGGWVLAADVACCVSPARPGNRHRPAELLQPGKVAARRFARLAGPGIGQASVYHYLKAWNLAAEQGLVPPSASLAPDSDPPLPDAERWIGFYRLARHGSPDPPGSNSWPPQPPTAAERERPELPPVPSRAEQERQRPLAERQRHAHSTAGMRLNQIVINLGEIVEMLLEVGQPAEDPADRAAIHPVISEARAHLAQIEAIVRGTHLRPRRARHLAPVGDAQ
jgi:hypothetical protein